jgi:hypothetical protein
VKSRNSEDLHRSDFPFHFQTANLFQDMLLTHSRDSAFGIASGFRLDHLGVGFRVPSGQSIFNSLYRPDCLWGRSCLLANGRRGLYRQGKSDMGVRLSTYLKLMQSSRKRGSMHPLSYTPSWLRAFLDFTGKFEVFTAVTMKMLRRVALVRTDVSEELSASFIKVTRIGELGTMLV